MLLSILLVAALAPISAIGVFRLLRPPTTPFMLTRAVIGGAPIDYRWMRLRFISSNLVRAVVAAEDARFMQHHGFDWTEVETAFRESEDGGRLRGASTISMQCARTLFLWPGRSMVRKAVEGYLTVLLEALGSKARILEVYLNLVEWGDGIYGCEAAAQRYFDVSCAALTAEQAATLAAILPNPRQWSARRPSPYIRKRIAIIMNRMTQVAIPRGERAQG